ncbi:hypothetical protein P3S67_019695 [Capsicum chacoense]
MELPNGSYSAGKKHKLSLLGDVLKALRAKAKVYVFSEDEVDTETESEDNACSLKDERMVEDHGHGKLGKLNECQTQTTRRFQEVGPLNAENVLGAENRRPVPKWEAIIRRTLNRMEEPETKLKSYSAPPSPVLRTSLLLA